MQLLCHRSQSMPPSWQAAPWVLLRRLAGLLALVFIASLCAPAQAQAPADKLLAEVGQWVQQSQQLSANQFTFAPIDGRVQLQSCDRALVMDSPFAARETVRVRCLGNPSWQLYLRVLLKPGVAPGLTQPVASGAGAGAGVSVGVGVGGQALAPGSAATAPTRRVVLANEVLRAGSVLKASMVREADYPVQGLDPQALASVKDIDNAELIRDIQPGVPLRSYDVRRAVLVKQGQSVLLTVGQGSGFSITARVEALQDGKMGEQIRLKNPDSGRLLSGVVTGPNAARGL